MHKKSVSTSQRTQPLSITKTNESVLFWEVTDIGNYVRNITAVFCSCDSCCYMQLPQGFKLLIILYLCGKMKPLC